MNFHYPPMSTLWEVTGGYPLEVPARRSVTCPCRISLHKPGFGIGNPKVPSPHHLLLGIGTPELYSWSFRRFPHDCTPAWRQSWLSKRIYRHLIFAMPCFRLGEDAGFLLSWSGTGYEHNSSSDGIRFRSGSTRDVSRFSTGSGSLGTADEG